MTAPWRPLLVAVVGALLAASGVWLAGGAGHGLTRKHVVADGVPLDEVHPASAPKGERRPGVVVAHGFAGSARLMAQFGDTLAARGFVVVLLDFSGHGANPHPLPVGNSSTDVSSLRLQHDLGVAMAHLRSLPDVDPARLALVGHSMGATAVTEYSAAHPKVTATVAISLPDASGVPADRPKRLLLLVGGLELASFHDAADHAAATGTGRRAEVVPHVEHISILFSPVTHRAVVNWLDAAFDGPPTPASGAVHLPSPQRRPGGAALLLIAFLIGLDPLARLLLGGDPRRWPRFGLLPIGRSIAVTAVASLAGVLVAAAAPTARLPLAIGGFLSGLMIMAGLLMLLFQHFRRRPLVIAERSGWRSFLAAPVLVAYAAAAIALPLQLGVTNAVPVGARWWLLGVVWASFALFAYAAERLAGGNSFGALAASAVVTIALVVAAVAGLTSTFLVLVVPLLAVLQLWQAFWSAVLHRFGAPSWLIATAGSLVIARPIATTLPLVS